MPNPLTHSSKKKRSDRRQNQPPVAAPLNPNPKWPEGYIEVLRNGIALAPRPDAPVQAFPSASPLVTPSFARLDQAENKPEQPPVLAPQAQPRHSQGIYRPERQNTPRMAEAPPLKTPYKTADQSGKLFLSPQLPRPTAPKKPGKEVAADESDTPTQDRVKWAALDARLRECLRLEHYSYRTEWFTAAKPQCGCPQCGLAMWPTAPVPLLQC